MKSSNELNEVFWAVLSIKGDHTAAGRSWSPQSYISQWEEIYFEAYERKPHDHVFYFCHIYLFLYTFVPYYSIKLLAYQDQRLYY